ncbi:vWA domain-containing protein [Modestobacter roseus]|uniref:vWA domain-containing protein n=1 Tax=Modestobacter roseus TaxID=1181884 RepID=UPI001AA0FE61|nr:VWA domain-containing protein [Modestobacter roseus]
MADLPVAPGPLAVGLSAALQRAGLPVTADRAARLARALRLVPPVDRDSLYWTARVTLVPTRAQLPLFDAVFSAVFDGRLDPADSRGDDAAPPAVGSEPRTRPVPPDRRRSDPATSAPDDGPRAGSPGAGDADGAERETVLAVASAQERLGTTAFAELEPGELAEVRDLVRRLVLATPQRLSRRSRPGQGRRIDVRRTVAAAQRRGGDVERLVFAERRPRARRLVLLCDVSGSMQPYSRVFLTLLQGAVADASAEAFVFATGVTRLTRQLAGRDVDAALARAAAVCTGWSGGTRLAASIEEFLAVFGRRGMARGAVVVVLSDGWATDPPEEVAAAMARLRRLAHRIVWVNPRAAAPGFAPRVGGMAAALPFCDAFVSGHSLAALQEVVAAVRAG